MNIERIQLLEKYIAEDPEEPFNRYALALELMHEDQPRATQILLDLIKHKPDYIPSYYQAATLLLDQNNFEEAKIVVERGLKMCHEQKDRKTANELRMLLDELD
ncbi:MAG: tetratricopeptide repeat protein [Cyclobacteriaceae bacterium]|nr:tetratricopeptide repeat protein [Cyclobacteriaceae bacterium]